MGENSPSSPILADHPLLAGFQQTLHHHLSKINAQLEQEIAEIDFNNKTLSAEREEIGTNLYDLQQEIERQRNTIDAYNEQIKNTFEERIKCEEAQRGLEKEYAALNNQYKELMVNNKERMIELDRIQAIEISIDKWRTEFHDELEASKRVISKDKQDKLNMSKEKKKMDFLLLNLEADLRRHESEIEEINEQKKIREDNLENLRNRLADANADLDGLQSEQKRLVGSWNDIVYAIEKRNKMLGEITSKLE